MRVPPMARQNRQQNGAQDVRLGRCVGTLIAHRAVVHPPVPQARSLQKLDEKCHLPERCYRRRLIPFHVDHSAEGIHRTGLIRAPDDYRSHRPAVFRSSMKNATCPKGVPAAVSSHFTWIIPPKVSTVLV